ncbi:related to splicing factor U2AF 35 kd subunit [Melanopsichium pennsylvanicum]|uniref:Related to splicing factor U2AF 35 kd subunit n=2 Tax=Melanopsichium pennsylvanicum TaxID=63383 RepID=A0AAJ5C6H7_9BASI|nr:related to splicing factor U2AF 35 kd subunit [Melanopsichium pennsylvanicum 4]SNX85860.1 related to splicing factor U2AF 35 kd subunit [Melanopsichium pennsylvanicum]
MASYLASIYGTEQDKVNCSFYYKIGACRHGDRCSRKHIRPPYSCTLLLSNIYRNPRHHEADCTITDSELQTQFDEFYQDMFCELSKYGDLIEMHVCDNVGDHLIGNVYARYRTESDAQFAVDALNDRWYDSKPLFAELSPVTDFQEACCRQNETSECNRGGFCNFMHLRYATRSLRKELNHQLAVELKRRNEQPSTKPDGLGKKKLGWKERLALEQGEQVIESDNDDDNQEHARTAKRDWKSGSSGGDWRSLPRTEPHDDAQTDKDSSPKDGAQQEAALEP